MTPDFNTGVPSLQGDQPDDGSEGELGCIGE
ncbi:hypothetical protein STRAU_3373 [Streptomyces aurantiacus JA 4570]|uniref:Uncharacterized protein n=1 Tax=Streptomyces aurantiacus JA 4570 TaxID=1286094 RepID=S3ZL96_9ACTN|nr:hypothetical protein STRAU_3373 [Streptomyces aurantiacus JA 4570]